MTYEEMMADVIAWMDAQQLHARDAGGAQHGREGRDAARVPASRHA